MKNNGFIRTAAAVPTVKVADVQHNTTEICRLVSDASEKEASLIVFPELSLTGYSCGDLFCSSLLVDAAESGVRKIVEFSRGKSINIVVGAPVAYRSRLYDCAVVIRNGNVKGIVPKIYISAEESRCFASGRDFLSKEQHNDGFLLSNGKDCVREGYCGEIRYAGQRCNISPNLLFGIGKITFAVEIGTDLWAPAATSSFAALQGAQLIAGLAADKEVLNRNLYRAERLRSQSRLAVCGYIYASAGFGESTQDNVFAGAASIWENGRLLAENERFKSESSLLIADIDAEKVENRRRKTAEFKSIAPDGTDAATYYRLYNRISLGAASETDFSKELYRYTEPLPFVPAEDSDYRCSEILSIQVNGLMTRLRHVNAGTAVIGISGGLDSTLALLVLVLAADRLGWSRDRIVAVTMPGFGTTSRTKNNAWELMQVLKVSCREISIVPACEQHFRDINHDISLHNYVFENSHARERTQILMDIANQTNGLVIGTGDLSELALGWATYNGDQMSMYGVNAGVPKTLVRSLVRWAAQNSFKYVGEILLDIVDTPISPELLPANDNGEFQQVSEDVVGPYELHDFFIYNFIGCGFAPEKVYFLALKAFEGIYDKETVEKWLRTFVRRFFNQQFKRSCMPDGPGVGSVTLSPRGGFIMPSDAWSILFQDNI